MVRLQIYLEKEQKRALERRAKLLDKSVAQLIREAIDKSLQNEGYGPIPEKDTFWNIIGLGQSQRGDLSTEHDKYLYGWKKR